MIGECHKQSEECGVFIGQKDHMINGPAIYEKRGVITYLQEFCKHISSLNLDLQ